MSTPALGSDSLRSEQFQHFDHFRMLQNRRKVKSGAPVHVHQIEMGTLLSRKSDEIRIAVAHCIVKRRPAVCIFDVYLCPKLQEQFSDFDIPYPRGPDQSGQTILIACL